MASYVVDLRNPARVVDFLVENVEYAAAKERAAAEKYIEQYHDGERIPMEKLAEAARSLAFATWPVRYALCQFFVGKGAGQEIEAILASVRPSTAHLIKRVHKASGTKTIDALLDHTDADIALQDGERDEIAHLRSQLRLEYWKSHAKTLASQVKEGEEMLKEICSRLDALRELASEMPPILQDELFAKLVLLEDQILYAGTIPSLSILDQEVQYYREQKALSPMEE